ncbi:LysR substrate binding domain-containing protein [Streptomyces atratus]|uniref:LysR substrate binding domain-containing protein n=2 Tax=Streptomyces atratus TaxID=1893 RepID=A0A1K1X3E3_STRAR|nr:LysR substrate binding domain-containing protein [Streptomyces atratus]
MAVVTHGGFTAAAGAELIVQSAPSTSVRNLERGLGAELPNCRTARGHRRVRDWHEDLVLITAPGHRLATAGRTLIKDLADEPFVDFRAGTGLETAVRRLAGPWSSPGGRPGRATRRRRHSSTG